MSLKCRIGGRISCSGSELGDGIESLAQKVWKYWEWSKKPGLRVSLELKGWPPNKSA